MYLYSFGPCLFKLFSFTILKDSFSIFFISCPDPIIAAAISIILLAFAVIHIIFPLAFITVSIRVSILAETAFGIQFKITWIFLSVGVYIDTFAIAFVVYVIPWVLITLRIFTYSITIRFTVLPLSFKCAIGEGEINTMSMVKVVLNLAIIVIPILKTYFYHILRIKGVLLLRLYLL